MVQTKDVWIEARFEAQKRSEHKRVPKEGSGSKERRRRQRVLRIYAEEEDTSRAAASLLPASTKHTYFNTTSFQEIHPITKHHPRDKENHPREILLPAKLIL